MNTQQRCAGAVMLVVLFFTISSIGSARADDDLEVKIIRDSDYLVHLEITVQSIDEEGNLVGHAVPVYLSGFVIGDTTKEIITASHFFDGSPSHIKALCYFYSRHNTRRAPQDITLIGWDKMLDVALFRFNDQNAVKDVPSAELGDSTSLLAGQKVITLGRSNPLQRAGTSGRIVQLYERLIPGLALQPELVIHDCILNVGGSGGPLVDMNDKIVGINLLILGPAHQGGPVTLYSAAVLINDVKTILPKLREGGAILHPPVEIIFAYTSEYDFRDFGYKQGLSDQGIMVERMKTDSLAYRAGLQFGDIVRSINGKKVPSTIADLNRLLNMVTQPYHLLEFEVERAGKRVMVPIALMKVRKLRESEDKGSSEEIDNADESEAIPEEKETSLMIAPL